MADTAGLLLFLAAALAIAVSPGPGLFYVTARSLAGGRAEGIASSLGTALGGSVHIMGGALGVSALLLASAEAFTVLKIAGAAYLVWLGIRTWREAGTAPAEPLPTGPTGARRAFREGVVVEALNPKTAAFFLAFVPQFVDPAGTLPVAAQFMLLGAVSVALNTGMDVIAAIGASRARAGLLTRPILVRRLRQASGGVMVALGAMLAFARRPA